MTKCFVIGPIGAPGSKIRADADDFIKYIVEPCIHEFGFEKPDRADRLPDPGRITSQIIEYLQSADLVIADLTGDNANVYYELSCRHFIGKPAIHMALARTDHLPFDVADQRTIFYTMHARDIDQAKEELAAQIKRVLEPGYKSRNPIVDAISLQPLEKSADPMERTIAALVRAVENLRGDVGDIRSHVAFWSNPMLGGPLGLGATSTPPQLGLGGLGRNLEQITAYHLPTYSHFTQREATAMMHFAVGQKWIHNDGKLRGEVVEISDEGRSGVLLITDDKGNTVDRYSGTAAGFQGPGQWRVVT